MAKKRKTAGLKLTKTERRAIATVNKVKKKLEAEKKKASEQVKSIDKKLRLLK
jgi:hypothetical protein